jgi:hypothetical protein
MASIMVHSSQHSLYYGALTAERFLDDDRDRAPGQRALRALAAKGAGASAPRALPMAIG